MKKWRRILLISIFIIALIGGVIGFLVAKSGVREVELFEASIDLFEFFIIFLLIFTIVCIAFDVYIVRKNKKKFGVAKFKLKIKTRKRLRYALIVLAFNMIFEFSLFFSSHNKLMIPACLMVLAIFIAFGFHYTIENGISESGILQWGIYHSWEDIISYKTYNETVIEMNVRSKFLYFKYISIAKFDFDKKNQYEINKFLAKRLKKS